MTTLYIKTHNKTGLKYFGKTSKTGKDFEKYLGSGLIWTYHIKKYGNDISTEILAQFDETNTLEKEKLIQCALNFSYINDIVNSNIWANLKFENGLDGAVIGTKLSLETKLKIGKKSKGRKHKLETILNISKNGIKNSYWRGKSLPTEMKQKISNSTKKAMTKEIKNIISMHAKLKIGEKNSFFGKHHTEDSKRKISLKNKNPSEETRLKMRLAKVGSTGNKGTVYEIITCPHCGKKGGGGNMKRYHFDECKYKPNLNHPSDTSPLGIFVG